MQQTKFIFVTGGVCSSLGKGLAASALGALLESYGYRIALAKIDPYLNLDAGTMSPIEHGEVYVTEDGTETDLDLGNYERFTTCKLGKKHSITTGQIYQTIIQKERKGDYLGVCVQMIPHVTDEIQRRLNDIATPDTHIAIVEVGGTVGDIESTIFLESIRQFADNIGTPNTLFLHVTLIPSLPGDTELKTKPTQHAVQRFREIVGIQPDILLCRLDGEMAPTIKKKLALFTHVPESAIIHAANFKNTIYELPLTYHQQGLSNAVLGKLQLTPKSQDILKWTNLIHAINISKRQITIGVIAKYIGVRSAYTSIYEALYHAGFANKAKVHIRLINSEHLKKTELIDLDGILVPGGFGERAIEGKIMAIKYARENNIPFLGICLGLQTLVIEYARHVVGLAKANSTEFDPNTPHPVVDLLATQVDLQHKGATMRLGVYASTIVPHTKLYKAYHQATTLYERHRHRYEVNNQYFKQFTQHGLIISSTTQKDHQTLVEAIEWPHHPFGIGVQFHPEFSSTPFKPHPLFSAFVQAILS